MNKVLNIAGNWLGYLEKRDGTPAYLYEKTANAGWNNYTCFWDICKANSLQAQPWCNAFVNACFIQAYGVTMAKKLLCTDGDWSYYTPTSSGYFKKKGQWHSTPAKGDIVYFQNSERICHVGIVTEASDSTITTIEGNTSSTEGVVANGGGVFKKNYKWVGNTRIAGFGRPNYGLIDADKYTVGWHKDNHGWWYADTTKTYYKGWHVINHSKYYFDSEGYAVTGKQTIDGKRYFFEDTAGASKECAMMVTDETGAFVVWRDK